MKAPSIGASALFFFSILVCASLAQALPAEHLSSQRFGGIGNDNGASVATDVSGNIYITGSFENTIDFGGGNLVSAGGSDIFLVKFRANGSLAWSQRYGGAGADNASAIAVTPAGDAYITGTFASSVDFGGGPLASAGNFDMFIAKFNTNSLHVFSLRFGSTSLDEGLSLAVDGLGSVYVTGDYNGTVDFGGGPLVSAGSSDVFVAKYSNLGAHQWSQRLGGTSFDTGWGVALDGMGGLVLTGSFSNTVSFGGANFVSNGNGDVFVAKYNQATGLHQWSASYGSIDLDEGLAIAATASGSVLVTGWFRGTVSFGGSSLVSAGSGDLFLAQYDITGAHQWSQRFGTSNNDRAGAVTVDAPGNVYITGQCAGSVDFGGGALAHGGGADSYLAKFNAAGVHQWSRTAGSTGSDIGRSVAIDNNGNVINVGSFNLAVSFGGNTLLSAGLSDIYLAKYSADYPAPVILSIVDVGNDQGRKVKIRFSRSAADDAIASQPVTRYAAFRRDIAPPPASAKGPGPDRLAAGWIEVASVGAYGDASYVMEAPTIGDSTLALGQYRSTFYIRAATAAPSVFFDSPPDSGYSMDNLAPGVPTSFAFEAGNLTWNESDDEDFDYFTVYGSNTDSFGSATAVDYAITPAMDVSGSPYVYYYVTATDFSGNEGKPAKVNTLSGVGGTPKSYVLSVSNYPNPFNPRTIVSYTVPSGGHVRVAIYDARGAHVGTLVDVEKAAGAYNVQWTPGAAISSGVYFARIEQNGATRTKKMVLLK